MDFSVTDQRLFTRAIVRKPGASFVNGITTSCLGKPDYDKAMEQHQFYINALRQCGLEVIVLEADDLYPDSTFVEDTAVLTGKCAIIANPGAESRKGETEAMQHEIEKYFNHIETIQKPGTLDGGDVMEVGDHYFIGISGRTNTEGAGQLLQILNRYGYSGSMIEIKNFLHLKSGVAYLGNGNILAAGELIGQEAFQRLNLIPVDASESLAANCIRVNNFVIIPTEYPKLKGVLTHKGHAVIEIDMSEFQKMDGGLSCLSLRF
ncbi:MAG: N(G),N(G)-dimethylarginine dimethylaminohydrolase [Deltaproteobacteria bacterium]|nr:N(G),N(G)-dimethylarginine dimethylaminohydrolase [Deltaproteobacteria bacterium]